MLDFDPLMYVDEVDGETFWHIRLPDETLLYYTPSGDMVTATKEAGDRKNYTPAVTKDFRHAVRSSKIAWRDKLKASKRKGRR